MLHGFTLGKLNTSLLAATLLASFIAIAAIHPGSSSAAVIGGGGLTTNSKNSNASKANGNSSKLAPRFGYRTLRQGMRGKDVRILKGIARSKSLLSGALNAKFDQRTTNAVKDFQNSADISTNGVVNKTTSKSMVRTMRRTEASWYGPGLYGNGVACGGTLRPGTIGVAHKTLPCGSKLMVGYRGRYLTAKVIDRGPYIAGRSLDLTYAAAESLGFIDAGVANVRYAVVKRGK
ncbi:MAG: RlpA-like double-psi beta-barrel domain-containing protein [Solirubrobacterales bacterium]